MKTLLRCGALIVLLTAGAAHAQTSTVDPTYPATNQDIDADTLRLQFQATHDDINDLFETVGTAGAFSLTGDVTATGAGSATAHVVALNGVPLGSTAAIGGNLLVASGSNWGSRALTGDCTVSSAGAIQCSKTGGVAFAPSATSDTTNAANIVVGNLSIARLNGGSGATSSTFWRGDGTWAVPPGSGGGGISGLTGDVTASGTGSVVATVTKTNGAPFAASATTDTTNAANISSGTLSLARIVANLFTSTLAGLVPASGGGTSNFLRADGAWITPPSSGGPPAPTTQTGNYTAALTDENGFTIMNCSSACAFTVPPNGSVNFPVGTELTIYESNTGAVSFVAGAGVTINTPSTLNLFHQYATASVKEVSTNVWVLAGNIQ